MVALLNWSVTAISTFNMIALIWLGLTVILNTERPRWGTWVVGGGLLLAGLFFTAHTAAVARLPQELIGELPLWWRVIWVPFVGGPYLWYLVMAWHAGVIGKRHRLVLPFVTLLGATALTLLIVASPLPSYQQFRNQPAAPLNSFAGVPVALLIYPVYSILCIVLAIEALYRPGATERFMGDVARLRARPWLIATSTVLLLVSFSVGAVAAWALLGANQGQLDLLSGRTVIILHVFDLMITSQLAIAIVLMGKAMVSYEIFTGKILPRGGLFRYWRNSLILAAGYGLLIGFSIELPVDPIYRLMLATVLMTLFYALLSWRSYADRERGMQRLRPFVASQHLYEQMITPIDPPADEPGANTSIPFRALCEEVLDTRVAALIPLGALAPLITPLYHPQHSDGSIDVRPLDPELLAQLATQHNLCVSVDPAIYHGAIWAVSLWSERGLIGALLLGPKRDNALYTQEEIEIGRAASERLVDTRASAELARRVVALQRRHLMESQIVDRRTRRVLHDDVLPQLHTTMLMLSGSPGSADAIAMLASAHRQIADLLHDLPVPVGGDIARLGLGDAIHQVATRELGGSFDSVDWQATAEVTERTRELSPLATEVLFYAAREAIRNAARHGRGGDPQRKLALHIGIHWDAGGLQVQIDDDGVGLGNATSGSGGGGRGLMLHSTMLAVVGGSLTAERGSLAGTRVLLLLPPAA
jgi:signal transduction histidine kinase